MQGTVHLLVGAALAILIPHEPTMVAAAFFSHYLLDLLPHIDAETFTQKDRPYTWTQWASLIVDILLVITLLIALYLLRNDAGPRIIIGAIVAQLPDLMIPIEQYRIFYPLYRIHTMFHWNEKRAKYWDWYIAGIFTPIAVASVALFVIWNY